ncbi:MAG: hypothetical protein HC896_09560 [Bacteroidales bacterium]|nr:hypothetical protein [Bacteroidales bacterium]
MKKERKTEATKAVASPKTKKTAKPKTAKVKKKVGRKNTVGVTIEQLITSKDRFIHSNELFTTLYPNAGKSSPDEFKRFKNQVSNALNFLKRSNKVASYQLGNSRRQVYWGLPAWMEGNNIKPGYEIKE